MSKILLLISQDDQDILFAQGVAETTALTLVHVRTATEGAKIIADQDISIICVDLPSKEEYLAFEKAIQDTVGLFSHKVNPAYIHFLSNKDIDGVQYLIQSPLFGNYAFKQYDNKPFEVGNHYGRVIKNAMRERAFGLQEIIGSSLKIQTVKLNNSTQKSAVIEAIKGFLIKAQFQPRTAVVVASAVDELLLNGIYDAPVDPLGKQIHAQLTRAAELPLEGRAEVEMQVAFDGNFVAVTVSDQWGSLDKAKLLTHISKIYVTDEYKVKTTVAGAGIGLATTFKTGASFYFMCEAGTRTQVTVFFRRTATYREFKQQFRFISTVFFQ